MKKVTTLSLVFLLTATIAFGQAKRYVLLEHFTNTLCSSCASLNPGLFSAIQVETNTNVHHISYHWRTPYSTCLYYQASPTRQDARADYYGIPGSPRVSSNGGSNTSLSAVTLAGITAAATTSPISVKVTENTGTNRAVVVKVKWATTPPAGTYVMHVAVVEKKTNYLSPNGESVHHNVFRTFLTTAAGEPIQTNTQTEQTINYTYPSANLGVESQLYTVAWVQNTTTKEVLNSGTKFDPTTATEEVSVDNQVEVSPNPTTGKTTLTFNKLTPQYLTVQTLTGQVVESVKLSNTTTYDLNLAQFAAGIYLVKIKSEEGVAIKRIVKN
ncbi:MAG: T9SS type A sorting domain-containing protein [Saprospiraceae bacterium]|nr:T9SS type A sorting domain-containing protein [Saprospiraceae bacterium]